MRPRRATVSGQCGDNWVAFVMFGAFLIVLLGKKPSPSYEASGGQIERGGLKITRPRAGAVPPTGDCRGDERLRNRGERSPRRARRRGYATTSVADTQWETGMVMVRTGSRPAWLLAGQCPLVVEPAWNPTVANRGKPRRSQRLKTVLLAGTSQPTATSGNRRRAHGKEGSTVRVRQRAFRSPCRSAVSVCSGGYESRPRRPPSVHRALNRQRIEQ